MIEIYQCSGAGQVVSELKSKPEIKGSLGGRCIVVQTPEKPIFVQLFDQAVSPREWGFSGKIKFTGSLGHSTGTFEGWNKLSGTKTKGIVYLRENEELVFQPLCSEDSPLKAVTDKVVFLEKAHHYSLGLFYRKPTGESEVFHKKIFDSHVGTMHRHFCWNNALYAVTEKEGRLSLEEFKVRHIKIDGKEGFESNPSLYPIKTLPQRVIPLDDSFLWVSGQDFNSGEVGEPPIITRFNKETDRELAARSFGVDQRIPIETLSPLASTGIEIFYKASEIGDEYGLSYFAEEELKPVLIVRNVLAAAASFTGNIHHLAFLEKLSDASRQLRVHERKDGEGFSPEPTYQIEIKGVQSTLVFFKPGYLGVGFDDSTQTSCFVYQLDSGKVEHSHIEREAGDSHATSGDKGLFHWISNKVGKDEEDIPTFTSFLCTQHVDRLFSKSGKAPVALGEDPTKIIEASLQKAFVQFVGEEEFNRLQTIITTGSRTAKRTAQRKIQKIVKKLVEE
jgi:hypothetical protein